MGSDINDDIAEVMGDVNIVNSYVERETFMIDKATKQIKGIDNMIAGFKPET